MAGVALLVIGCLAAGDGAAPQAGAPAGARPPVIDSKTVVLFDVVRWDGWRLRDGAPSPWPVQPDGSVQVVHPPSLGAERSSDSITSREFGDHQLHIEFLCPITEGKEGQARSNSGVYIHGRYEIQVLDSCGAAPADNLCGGIYKVATPLVNAARPAGEWQTYDIVFRAPRFDASGAIIEKPRITVIHNGLVIHNNIELPSTTAGGIDRTMVPRGPLLLQDHGDPVRFRNIWARDL
jgi:hypothetical protein